MIYASAGVCCAEEAPGIAFIRLCRAPVNALDTKMKRALATALEAVAESPGIRCLVFASNLPRTFCAGSDLSELAVEHRIPGRALERTRFEFQIWEKIAALRQPTIAAVDGHALGSGLELALACDFRIGGRSATFGLPEISIGGGPGPQAIARLVFLVGLARARRMLIFGERLDAAAAAEVGLVDQIAPAGSAVKASMDLAARLTRGPASAYEYVRRVLSAVVAPSVTEARAQANADVERLFLAAEMAEGIRAFLEKRAPDFARLTGEVARATQESR
jgi:enoyl-CoA hydratase/carnithine racemase